MRTGRLIVHRDVARRVGRRLPRSLRGALPDPSDGSGRRVRRERLPLDRGGQHVGVQLPLRRGDDALVEPCVRDGDRRQSDREPVRVRRPHVASCEPPVRRPSRAAGREWRTRAARSYVRSTGSAGAGEVAGRPSRTTSTSPRAATRAPDRREPSRASDPEPAASEQQERPDRAAEHSAGERPDDVDPDVAPLLVLEHRVERPSRIEGSARSRADRHGGREDEEDMPRKPS